jgi:hypothetical protein
MAGRPDQTELVNITDARALAIVDRLGNDDHLDIWVHRGSVDGSNCRITGMNVETTFYISTSKY